VPTAENGHYDLNQLKEDAKWLSSYAWIDEVAALRLVVLEWQTRPAAQLLSGFTEEESLSVKDAAGGTNLGASRFLPASSILAATPGQDSITGFASEEQRRFRLLKLHLLEKVHIIRVSDILLRVHVFGKGKTAQDPEDWLVEAGATIFKNQRKEGKDTTTSSSFIEDAIVSIQRRFERLEKGSGWYEDQGGNPAIEEVWGISQLVEIIHILQLLLTHLDDTVSGILPSKTVLSWFRFAGRFGFFTDFVPVSVSTSPQ
jgi:nuclear pore complex protein Nup188